MDNAGIQRQFLPLVLQLLRDVVVQPARKGQHESHHMCADVVVVDFTEIGDRHWMGDQLRIVIAGGRRRLRRLQPAQPLRLPQQVGGIVPNAASAWAMTWAAWVWFSATTTLSRQPIPAPLTRAAIFLVVTVNSGDADTRPCNRCAPTSLRCSVRLGFASPAKISPHHGFRSEAWDWLLEEPRSAEGPGVSRVVVGWLSCSAFALTDPGVRLSRTRLFPRVTRVMPSAPPKDE